MMKFDKVLIVGFEKGELFPETIKNLKNLSKQQIFSAESDPKLHSLRQKADCLLVKFNPVTKSDIENSPNLKYIGVMSTGFARVDTAEAKRRKITVTNVPGYSTQSVAEFVFASLLEKLRDLEKAKAEVKKGNYSEAGFNASEIKDKNFGVLGLGRIGGRVAELAESFGAHISYWSKHRKKDLEKKGIKYQSLEKLISQSDFLSINLALNDKTKNFLNRKRINMIKKGAIVINTAPMELLDLSAIEEKIKDGDLTFILDHSDEMKTEDLERLSRYKNCIIYPPIAYISEEAKKAKQDILIENIRNFLSGKPTNTVN